MHRCTDGAPNERWMANKQGAFGLVFSSAPVIAGFYNSPLPMRVGFYSSPLPVEAGFYIFPPPMKVGFYSSPLPLQGEGRDGDGFNAPRHSNTVGVGMGQCTATLIHGRDGDGSNAPRHSKGRDGDGSASMKNPAERNRTGITVTHPHPGLPLEGEGVALTTVMGEARLWSKTGIP